MGSGFDNIVVLGIFALFYGIVISAIVISFWKIHSTSRQIDEIKTLLIEIKGTIEQMKK